MHIDTIKNLFLDYAVLLSLNNKKSNALKRFSDEIDNLKTSSKIMKGKIWEYFDYNKEKRLFQIVREISIELSPYFMPKKEEDEDDY